MKNKVITTILRIKEQETIGIASRVNILKYLENDYKLIILTNDKEFLKERINAEFVYIPFLNLGRFSILFFLLLCTLKLFFIRYDLLFLYHNYAYVSLLNFKSKVLCYVLQTHEFLGLCPRNDDRLLRKKLKDYKAKFDKHLALFCIKHATYCLAVSRPLVSFLIKAGVDSEKIDYLPHSVDSNLFRKQEARSLGEPFTMVYTGSVCEHRGLYLMLEGVVDIKKTVEDVKLIMVGCDEKYLNIINEFARKNEISSNIQAIGKVDQKEIPQYVAKADVCLSFLDENITYSLSPPQKIFEYFAMGKPVIANRIATHTDFITDGFNGFVIGLKKDEFVESALKLCNDKLLQEKMSKNAYEYSKNHDVEHIKFLFLNKLEQVVQA